MNALRPTFLLGLAALAVTTAAQVCPDPANDTFWKNDSLPDVPSGLTTVAVIPGVCDGEAIGTLFQLGAGSPAQLIKQVAVPFGEQFGSPGFQALVNIEIYERRPGDPPYPNPGTKVFDLNADANLDAQIASHGINTIDLTPYNVVVEYDFSVVCRANFNVSFPGCPPSGAQANFFTDNGPCTPGVNYLDIAGQGWSDPATATVLGFPLCPLFYKGNWVVRACTVDTGAPASATFRNGTGVNPAWFQSLTDPEIGTTWISSVDVVAAGANFSFVAATLAPPLSGIILPQGELLIDVSAPLVAPLNVAAGAHAIPIPLDGGLIGLPVYTQAATFQPGVVLLTNALDLVLGV